MDPVTIIIGLGVVIVVAVVSIFRPLRKIAISTSSLTVSKDAQAPLVAVLVYKGWFSFSFQMLPGTVTFFTGSSVISIAPLTVNTTGAVPVADLTVTGVAKGTGTITINGTSAEGTHDTETVAVTVV
jgi:hypothetical protein